MNRVYDLLDFYKFAAVNEHADYATDTPDIGALSI